MAIIKVENLSKKYIIGHQNERYVALRDVIAQSFDKVGSRLFKSFTQRIEKDICYEEFWALKDINFEINQGDRVGIIGRNGAGKSTLLKVLSRITSPTSGSATIKGRVASLLEVGTGFHPELTGRENIYLNGAILGMKKSEIKRKFDEIVAFAEVEKFLDTPVKRYSSGMSVRLAFAVAAHLEPEILIVDEVLAVGDAQFQKKCLGKMDDVAKMEKRTVLFVSHNMNAIEQLCNYCILIQKGKIIAHDKDTRKIIKQYLSNSDEEIKSYEWTNNDREYENKYYLPLKLFVCDASGSALPGPYGNSDEIYIQIDLEIKNPDPALQIGYAVLDEKNDVVYWTATTDEKEELWPKIEKGFCSFRAQIPKHFLNEGEYRIGLLAGIHFGEFLANPQVNSPCINFVIQGGLSDSPFWIVKRPGVAAPVIRWNRV